MLEFNALDWGIIAVVLLSSAMGFVRGIIRELFTALAIVLGAAAVLVYVRNAEQLRLLSFLHPEWLEVFATAIVLFALVFIGVGFASRSLATVLHKSAEIGAIDRSAGAVYGFARAALLVVLAVVLIRHVTPPDRPAPQLLREARLYPALTAGAKALEALIQEKKPVVEKRVKRAIRSAVEEPAQ
jgi:membrane protein required for colicin V production